MAGLTKRTIRRVSALFALPTLVTLGIASVSCGAPADELPNVESPADSGLSAAVTSALSVAPSTVPAGGAIHIAGCGYPALATVSGEDLGPTGTEYWGARSDAAGCIALDTKASYVVGTHTLKAYVTSKRNRRSLAGQTTLYVTPAPLGVISEDYTFRWDATKACVGEDDALDWTARGTLAPGQSFSFTPRYPDCDDPRAVMVHLTSDAGSNLRLGTVVPEDDDISNDVGQKGREIIAPTVNGAAQLCMFPNTSFTPPAGYTITVTNLGTATANVTVSGKDYNDWSYYYWNDCLLADADHDGWSDSHEHAMAQLVYPTGNYMTGSLPAGTDYLRACGTAAPNDEFDAWPPDLDDDGVVTQADVDLVRAHVGEGNGVPWSAISPNDGIPEAYWNHVGSWNRFDLNADGWVDSSDVDLVKASLGKTCGQ